jgi:hypothetical protein
MEDGFVTVVVDTDRRRYWRLRINRISETLSFVLHIILRSLLVHELFKYISRCSYDYSEVSNV